jgi:hypothetical protein
MKLIFQLIKDPLLVLEFAQYPKRKDIVPGKKYTFFFVPGTWIVEQYSLGTQIKLI